MRGRARWPRFSSTLARGSTQAQLAESLAHALRLPTTGIPTMIEFELTELAGKCGLLCNHQQGTHGKKATPGHHRPRDITSRCPAKTKSPKSRPPPPPLFFSGRGPTAPERDRQAPPHPTGTGSTCLAGRWSTAFTRTGARPSALRSRHVSPFARCRASGTALPGQTVAVHPPLTSKSRTPGALPRLTCGFWAGRSSARRPGAHATPAAQCMGLFLQKALTQGAGRSHRSPMSRGRMQLNAARDAKIPGSSRIVRRPQRPN